MTLVDLYSFYGLNKSALGAKQVQGLAAEADATNVVRADWTEAIVAHGLYMQFKADNARKRKRVLERANGRHRIKLYAVVLKNAALDG